jgi:hypothetical protein
MFENLKWFYFSICEAFKTQSLLAKPLKEKEFISYLGKEEVFIFSRGGSNEEEFILWPGFEPPGRAPEGEGAVPYLDREGVVPWPGVEPPGCAPEGEGALAYLDKEGVVPWPGVEPPGCTPEGEEPGLSSPIESLRQPRRIREQCSKDNLNIIKKCISTKA